jgi:hypothetical protein
MDESLSAPKGREITVRQLGNAVNANVIQLETRKFPSLVIQGDSMSILFGMAQYAREHIEQGDPAALEEGIEELRSLEELLLNYLVIYEQSLIESGIPLPYNGSYIEQRSKTHE